MRRKYNKEIKFASQYKFASASWKEYLHKLGCKKNNRGYMPGDDRYSRKVMTNLRKNQKLFERGL